ncbi:MAG: 30S ribosomal protein S6 [Verrucomicrobiae bacterium]|nr:30S ribosomal protein S6 [Verrucomicrobiae bacterium]
MKYYEALYILNVQGQDEAVSEAIEGIEKEIKNLEGKVEGVQKLERRKFERGDSSLDSGFYVNVILQLAPEKLETLRSKLTLNPSVFRQMYLITSAKPAKKKASRKKAEAATA